MCYAKDPNGAMDGHNCCLSTAEQKECLVCSHPECGLCLEYDATKVRATTTDGRKTSRVINHDFEPTTPEWQETETNPFWDYEAEAA